MKLVAVHVPLSIQGKGKFTINVYRTYTNRVWDKPT